MAGYREDFLETKLERSEAEVLKDLHERWIKACEAYDKKHLEYFYVVPPEERTPGGADAYAKAEKEERSKILSIAYALGIPYEHLEHGGPKVWTQEELADRERCLNIFNNWEDKPTLDS